MPKKATPSSKRKAPAKPAPARQPAAKSSRAERAPTTAGFRRTRGERAKPARKDVKRSAGSNGASLRRAIDPRVAIAIALAIADEEAAAGRDRELANGPSIWSLTARTPRPTANWRNP